MVHSTEFVEPLTSFVQFKHIAANGCYHNSVFCNIPKCTHSDQTNGEECGMSKIPKANTPIVHRIQRLVYWMSSKNVQSVWNNGNVEMWGKQYGFDFALSDLKICFCFLCAHNCNEIDKLIDKFIKFQFEFTDFRRLTPFFRIYSNLKLIRSQNSRKCQKVQPRAKQHRNLYYYNNTSPISIYSFIVGPEIYLAKHNI